MPFRGRLARVLDENTPLLVLSDLIVSSLFFSFLFLTRPATFSTMAARMATLRLRMTLSCGPTLPTILWYLTGSAPPLLLWKVERLIAFSPYS